MTSGQEADGTAMVLTANIINIVGFVIMGVDKKRARNGKYRISEKTLWFWAVIGGGTGTCS